MAKPFETAVSIKSPVGPLQLFRYATNYRIHCFRCGKTKVSKNIVTYRSDWDRLLCNACYGELLALHKACAHTGSSTRQTDQLSDLLRKLVTEEQARSVAERLNLQREQHACMSPDALYFLRSGEFLATHLREATELDWSGAVVEICKAFEYEMVRRLMDPLKVAIAEHGRMADAAKESDVFRSVAEYCGGKRAHEPELGVMEYFINRAAHSKDLAKTSVLIKEFRELVRQWPQSAWLLKTSGAADALKELAGFRNRASHTGRSGRSDYEQVKEIVTGAEGIMWDLYISTSP